MAQPETSTVNNNTTTTTFGASILHDHRHETPATTLQSLSALTPAVSQDSLANSYADRAIPPYSPFYQHPPASHERVAKAQYPDKGYLDVNIAERGLSRDDLTPLSVNDKNPFCSTISVNTNKECTMWPSRQTLTTTKLSEKKRQRSARFCACAGLRHSWEQLHKNHRLSVRIALALLIIGAMIGLGLGISKAVHGSYYSGSGHSTTT